MVDLTTIAPLQLANRLKLRHLRFVRALAASGSLQQAAERLAITYAAAVKTRQEIEAAIGAPLLQGRGDAAVLTPVAKLIDARARRVLHELDCLGEEVVELQQGLCGHVTVGVRLSHALSWLVPALLEFRERHPGISLTLDHGLHTAVVEGVVDIGVGRMGSPHWHDELEFTPITPVRTVLIGSGAAAAHAGPDFRWDTVLGLEWCLPPVSTPLRDRFEDFLRERGLESPGRVIVINDFQTHVELMKAGSFMGLCSEPSGRGLQRDGIARVLHGPMPEMDDEIALFSRAGWRLRPAVRSLREFLQQRASAQPSG